MVIVTDGWKNAEHYDKIAQRYVNKRHIWSYKQNYPDLVVEDVMEILRDVLNCEMDCTTEKNVKDMLYSVLLERGVNKWLATRKLLIRLKKVYSLKIKEFEQKMLEAKEKRDWNRYWYYKGKMSAYVDVRMETSTLCKGPRWVIFNGKNVGLVDTIGMKRGDEKNWLKLYDMLNTIRFKK